MITTIGVRTRRNALMIFARKSGIVLTPVRGFGMLKPIPLDVEAAPPVLLEVVLLAPPVLLEPLLLLPLLPLALVPVLPVAVPVRVKVPVLPGNVKLSASPTPKEYEPAGMLLRVAVKVSVPLVPAVAVAAATELRLEVVPYATTKLFTSYAPLVIDPVIVTDVPSALGVALTPATVAVVAPAAILNVPWLGHVDTSSRKP